MASHVVMFKNMKEFFQKMKERDKDMMRKMVKTILHAIKSKKHKVDVFQVIFSDTSDYTFTVESDQYVTCLKNCMGDMVKAEEYELCAQIRDVLQKDNKNDKSKLKFELS